LVTAVDGSHSGDIGRIDEITVTAGSGDNTVTVATDDGAFETIEDYVVVIDDQFVDDEDADAETDADADADDESADGGDDE
jgi:small subunit ribosomal protein S4e